MGQKIPKSCWRNIWMVPKSFYEYFPSKVFTYKIFRIFLQWPSMNFVWNALRSINHNILWIIFFMKRFGFFQLRSQTIFPWNLYETIEKNVEKLVLSGPTKMLLFSIYSTHTFKCNIYTKKLNFCSVFMLSIYFCCALPSDNGAKVFL